MVSPFESVKIAQEKCPFGYRVVYGRLGQEKPPINGIRIGQCKVRHGDPEFPLYAVPISMVEARKQLASEYQNSLEKLEQIKNIIENKTRVRTSQIKDIIG